LTVTPDSSGKQWHLTKPFSMNSDKLGKITCPKGMTTDFASIPPLNLFGVAGAIIGLLGGIPWIVAIGLFVAAIAHTLQHIGSYTKAAVIHDYLYGQRVFSRADCDAVLLEGMIACGTSKWKRIAIYGNVRLFGWTCWHGRRWNEYRKKINTHK